MAQFVVLQIDAIPAVGEMVSGLRAWRISANTEADAATAVGEIIGDMGPVVLHVASPAGFRRFTTSATMRYGSTEG